MTPKEKAKELFQKFSSKLPWYSEKDNLNKSKQCALIACEELLNQCWDYRDIDLEKSYDYWQEVKQEIEKL